MICYNCGLDFSKKDITKEHIPAKNLFSGYQDSHKKNLITVHGCGSCNHQYSVIDQEIRNAIGIMNDKNPDQQEITRQAVKSILMSKDGKKRLHFSENGNVMGVSFNYATLVELHKKHFKALFYERYQKVFNVDEYNLQVICEGDEDDEKAMQVFHSMSNYLNDQTPWSISGHEDIFQYKMKTLADLGGNKMGPTISVDDAFGITAILVYHKNLCAVVVAMKKNFVNKLMN